MKITVVQADNRSDEKLGWPFIQAAENNAAWAKMQGYDYVFHHSNHPTLPPYWAKVDYVLKALQHSDAVLWLDTDAIVYDTRQSLAHFLNTPHWFVGAPDPPIPNWTAPFNAGVFLVKKEGIELLEDWLRFYDASKWHRENENWTCYGAWAGVDYEQGAFNQYILPLYREKIKIVDWKVFQSVFPSDQTFTLHFLWELKAAMWAYLELRGK